MKPIYIASIPLIFPLILSPLPLIRYIFAQERIDPNWTSIILMPTLAGLHYFNILTDLHERRTRAIPLHEQYISLWTNKKFLRSVFLSSVLIHGVGFMITGMKHVLNITSFTVGLSTLVGIPCLLFGGAELISRLYQISDQGSRPFHRIFKVWNIHRRHTYGEKKELNDEPIMKVIHIYKTDKSSHLHSLPPIIMTQILYYAKYNGISNHNIINNLILE